MSRNCEMIGRTVDHYRIEAKLGEGGMGVVYRAVDSHLDRLTAIKVLPPEMVADGERKRRFVQEAKAASALNHPNIVTIYDIGTSGEDPIHFIAMEYVEGRTLAALIREGRLTLEQWLAYAVQIASGMAAAHAAGIVHRDLKPANIMVDNSGRVKVLDFGLAKLAETPASVEAPTKTLEAETEPGVIWGTGSYMSPEQVEGKPLDARSDVFSLGSVFYEMLTGRRAFQADSYASLLSAIVRDNPVPLRTTVPNTPAGLQRIVARCLHKDRDALLEKNGLPRGLCADWRNRIGAERRGRSEMTV